MTEAEKAFELAKQLIAEALESGAQVLSFDREETHALEVLPDSIGNLKALRRLDCDNTKVSDLSPVSGLTGLRVLSLDQTSVSDLSPVSGLPGLERLYLSHASVSDLSPVSGLRGLRGLHLDQTYVSDLSPVSGLTRLAVLYLDQTSVSDLSPVSGLTGLEVLSLDQTSVSDLSPVSDLTGLERLYLDQTSVSDLSPVSGLRGLRGLHLDQTSVSDLSPVSGLTGLERLYLSHTSVSDLSPVSGLRGLRTLSLNQSSVLDLRPIQGLSKLVEHPGGLGLVFQGCTAANADPRIAEIADIEDASERARTLFDYLETWVPPGEGPKSNTPEPDPLFRIVDSDDRLEVAASTPSEAERDERLKQVLHQQLRDRSSALAQQAGNRFFRLAARARSLTEQVEKDFSDLDLLMLHLAVEDLRALEALGREDEDGEAFPPEVMVAVDDVLRLGPGLTLGNEDVETLVERANRRRGAPPVPAEELKALDDVSDVLASDPDAIGDNLRDMQQAVAHSDTPEDREVQKGSIRSVLWRVAVWGGGGIVAGAGLVAGDALIQLLSPPVVAWVKSNAPVLVAGAQTYGVAFAEWFLASLANVPEFASFAANIPDKRPVSRTGKTDD